MISFRFRLSPSSNMPTLALCGYAASFARLLLVFLMLGFVSAGAVHAAQEITETGLVKDIFDKNLEVLKQIKGMTLRMKEHARPFTNPRYAAKYRFAPSDQRSRTILSMTRSMEYRFRTLFGIMSHAQLPGQAEKVKSVLSSIESMATATKRSLRAIKDGNATLYLGSAQTIEIESQNLAGLVSDLEGMINTSIRVWDSKKEEL